MSRRYRTVYVLLVAIVQIAVLASAGLGDDEAMLVVHYKRYAGDYDDWTLWTWDANTGQDPRELKAVALDDYGLVFNVPRAEYGAGTQIGLLPKFREWESKDPPDRIWKNDMGDEVWILSGHPMLFTAEPSDEMVGEEVGPVLTVHYHRPQGDYSDWTLWTWDDRTEGDSREIASADSDDYGVIFKVERQNYGGDGMQIGLLPKFGNWSSKDPPDRVWLPYMGDEVWILAGNEELFTEMPDTTPWIIGAFVDGRRVLTVALSAPVAGEQLKPENFRLTDDAGSTIAVSDVRVLPTKKGSTYLLAVTVERDFDVRLDNLARYVLTLGDFKPATLSIRGILDAPEFYSEKEMGAIYSKAQTIFRVFAPTARTLKVVLYEQPAGGLGQGHDMAYTDNGIWELTVPGDLNGTYYTLKASGHDPVFDPSRELIDPYSRCNTAHDGRGMVVADKTPITPAPVFDISEAVIYELHVRDFTIASNSGIEFGGKYLGFTETDTRVPGDLDIRTGIDHLEDLGVNVVHVMPIQDFDNDESEELYNWGYMPVHFNSPDGWYATEQHGVARVREFKFMIDALHKKGIKVVMDVVYNHTAEYQPSKIFSFEGLVPGYYYRLRDDGSYWNGSGTGNETRSEARMMRKFIIESCKYWVDEYDVDGFRFDLMGLIDLETMVRLVEELRAIKPDIIVYGEPWAGGDTPIRKTEKGSQRGKGFAVFGDHFRDAIKGGVFDLNPGYVQAGINIDRIKLGIEGSINDFTDSPIEVLNYVASHDNRTFWDRLIVTTRGDKTLTDEDRKSMDKLGATLVLTSQGIPFIHSGQEMLRTKRGDHNSYNKPDAINMINWQWKRDNLDIFNYYKGLIALRKAHPMFRMKTRDQVVGNLRFLDEHLGIPLPPRCVAYQITKGDTDDSWNEALVLLNPNRKEVTFTIPEGDWTVVVDDDEAGTAPVGTGESDVSGDKVRVSRISAKILCR
jgi:pullulanase